MLLVEALASTGPAISLIPVIRTEGGEDGVDKVVDGQKGTKVDRGGAAGSSRGHLTILPLVTSAEPAAFVE